MVVVVAVNAFVTAATTTVACALRHEVRFGPSGGDNALVDDFVIAVRRHINRGRLDLFERSLQKVGYVSSTKLRGRSREQMLADSGELVRVLKAECKYRRSAIEARGGY